MRHKTTYYIFLILFILSLPSVFSQTIVCENSSCTANDYSLDSFYLGDEDGVAFGPGYCDPGDVVNAHIWTNFIANSAAPRYTLYLHFNLYVDGVFEATIDECYYVGQPIPTDVTLDVYDFSWACGAEITLEDFYMSWQPNPNAPCDCNNAKCYKDEVITVLAPLIANFEFNPSCLSAYTVDFNSTTSGGNPPYTYLWDFGDGGTSTLQNPSHTYTGNGPYTVTLTVFDQDNTDYYEFEIISFEPNLPPELYPPANLNIEGCGVPDIPDLPYSPTQAEITEAQFIAAGGTLVISSAIISLSYIDSLSGSCPIVITRTFTVVDSCNNTDSNIQLITIDDTTLPTASNPPTIQVQCKADIPSPNILDVTDAADNCSTPTVIFVSDVSDNNSCPEVIIRTYSITDDCGNMIEVNQSIIINDDILPTASNPTNVFVECMGDVPSPDVSIITDEADNCSAPTVEFISDQLDGNSCPIIITRTYRVTDACGNAIDLIQLITVDDGTAPTATGPANISVQCVSQVPAENIADITNVSDNCAIPVVAFVSDVSDNGSCPEIITRTYSITDDCGNQTLITQTITILDDIAPTASAPAPLNVQCIGDIPAPDINLITDETDNCSMPSVLFISDTSTGQCPQIITRTYRISDDCGNFIDVQQAINVNDDILPTASNPPDLFFDCSDAIPVPDISVITDASDNCSNPIVAFISDTSDGNCPETITRLYSVTDACGNSITLTQDLISDDTEAPTLITPLNDETVSCLAIPPAPVLEFEDNCTTNLSVDFTETDTNVNNTVDYVITREWIVTDNCGNSSMFTQIINVLIADCIVSACNSCGPSDDTIPPTASDPADINVLCTDDIPPPNVNVVIDEADNCVPPIVAFVSESISVDCFQKVSRVYSVTDECGNQILVSHNINVIDTILPTATNPNPIDVGCNEDIPAPDVNVVTDEADNCSTPVVAFVSDVSDNACNERITRTYSVTDSCGNSILVTQLINITDLQGPTASNPSDIDVSCINDIPIPDPSVVTDESDNCSVPTVTFLSDVSDLNSCPETITRTYRITDDCGNFTDVVQLIKINDDVNPTASTPQSIQVSCITDVPLPNVNVITDEADNCSIPTVSFIFENSDNLSCPETITRTYRITDACGNSIDVLQQIIVDDDIFPTASNPNTIQVATLADVPSPDISVVTDEADNCGIPMVAFVSDVSDNMNCPETITRTYSVTDACDNAIEVIQLIRVNDNEPPSASNPPSEFFNCENNIPSPNSNIITDATDNDSVPVIAFLSETTNGETCPEVITRIYSVTDDCGNSIEVSHTLVIDDDIPPTASDPLDTVVFDISDVPSPDIEVVTDEFDNCSVPTVNFVSELNNNDACPEIITRTYSVTDACGNSINVFHNIYIEDIEPPTASNPANVTLYCTDPNDIPAPDTSIITDATDNTSIPEILFVSDTSDDGACPEVITRVYRITDGCGNSIDVSHAFSLYNDQVPPTATPPQALQLQCFDDLPEPDVELITDEADDCTTPTVTFTSETMNTVDCQSTIARIYTITDDCGNAIDVEHLIIIEDTNAPVLISEIDEELNLTCDTVPEIPIVEFTDECDQNFNLDFEENIIDTGEYSYDVVRTWTATDECDNNTTLVQTIHMTNENVLNQSDINLCITDNPINLSEYVSVEPGGIWESSDMNLLIDTELDPTDIPEGNYQFTYTINENDCVRTHELMVNINDLCVEYPCIRSTADVNITKMVTPNNDGYHDYLEVSYVLNDEVHSPCAIVTKVLVYNRWGTKVFESHNYNNDWNGSAPSSAFGNSELLPTGSYYYIVELLNSGLKPIQGYIYLGVDN